MTFGGSITFALIIGIWPPWTKGDKSCCQETSLECVRYPIRISGYNLKKNILLKIFLIKINLIFIYIYLKLYLKIKLNKK